MYLMGTLSHSFGVIHCLELEILGNLECNWAFSISLNSFIVQILPARQLITYISMLQYTCHCSRARGSRTNQVPVSHWRRVFLSLSLSYWAFFRGSRNGGMTTYKRSTLLRTGLQSEDQHPVHPKHPCVFLCRRVKNTGPTNRDTLYVTHHRDGAL